MGMGGGDIDTGFIDQAKGEALGFLDTALRTAVPYSEFFTEKALEAQREQFQLARSDTEKYYEIAQAQTAPYREAGFQALDTLQDTLGMSRLDSGSSAMYHAMENKAKMDAARREKSYAVQKLVNDLNINPEDAYKLMQSGTYGSNYPGLMETVSQFAAGGMTPFKDQVHPLKATKGSVTPGEAGVGGEGELSYGGGGIASHSYQDMLDATQARFSPNPLSTFTADMLPLSAEYNRARQNLSSRQRTLAQLGKTGYSHLDVVPTEV